MDVSSFLPTPPLSDPNATTERNMKIGRRICDSTIDLSLLSPEVVVEVREALKRDFFLGENWQYRAKLAYIWSPPNSINGNHKMLALDSIPNPKKRGRRILYIDTWREYLFYNKTTVFYFIQPATKVSDFNGFNGPKILGGIWNAWSDSLGREPHMQLDEFFAVPVIVDGKYAKTVLGILRVHEHICAQLRRTIGETNTINATKSFDWPDPRYFKLLRICEALIVVFDEYNPVVAEKHADGRCHLDDVAQQQSIILARTGHENKLSAPIGFESLKDKLYLWQEVKICELSMLFEFLCKLAFILWLVFYYVKKLHFQNPLWQDLLYRRNQITRS